MEKTMIAAVMLGALLIIIMLSNYSGHLENFDQDGKVLNTESFSCVRPIPTPISAIFITRNFRNYSQSTVRLGKDNINFYAFVRETEKADKIRKSENTEWISTPSGDWVNLKSLPAEQQAKWLGIGAFFTEEEKVFFWRCAWRQKGFRRT